MLNETYESTDDKTLVITQEMLNGFNSCIRSTEGTQRMLFGGMIGATAMTLPLFFVKSQAIKRKALAFAFVGGLCGYQLSRFRQIKDCFVKVLKDSGVPEEDFTTLRLVKEDMSDINIYKSAKNDFRDQELPKGDVLRSSTRESIFDTDSPPQMDLLDDFPVINESADVINNNEPKKTVTYKELRQRNRESYKPRIIGQKPMWYREQNIEQPVQSNEFMEPKEPIFPEQSTGKHRTKYGDVWD